ncbi:Auxin Efflux Carrier family protein [Trichomonas vaginalis G3]|uniref:Auxin Efflux Carrier family protein n=1 Tax=Trichomonas vaginalis (strain ATCC PRA-98 / G3) TaxID=412133 RepID=A2EK33_TRIV3|nr:intracellular auxin transport [Trichomonas vaginalis G3]EAY07017.1 Auxin Efflux Carrier family protein [Trichomonas vaginalis G3]KAI5488803.1 intracellular auxin transport [Trichomonas vaginalis G3]|eukprot:XP_001319240.1 Auxin Efflux Carrier family protein [Trichomonas vaginalis G3]
MVSSTTYINVIEESAAMLLVILLGYFGSIFKMFEGPAFKGFSKFSGTIAFPLLLFDSIAETPFKDISPKPLINSLLSSILIHVLCGGVFFFKFEDTLEVYLATVCASCYINYIIIGLPIFESIWGTSYDVVPGIASFGNCIISVPLFIIGSKIRAIKLEKKKRLEELGDNYNKDDVNQDDLRTKPKDILMAFYAALKNPIVVGNCAGLIWSAIGVKPPIFLNKFTTYYGACIGYLALFGLGRFLHQESFVACKWYHLIICLVIRFIIYPLVSLGLAVAFKLDNRLARQCIILSMLPTANSAFILAESLNCGSNVISTVILWTLIFIVPVIILWEFVMNSLNLFPDNLSDIQVS